MRNRSSYFRHGLSLAEALVALAICAALLAAMAIAFSAAGNATEMNDHYFRSLQQARSGLDLMITEVRRCSLANGAIITVSPTSVTLPNCPDFSGHSITFTYNNSTATSNPSSITLTDNTTGVTSLLVGETSSDTLPVIVSAASFGGGNSYNVSSGTNGAVSLTMTVQLGLYPIMNQVVLSGSAAPRQSVTNAFQ